MIGVALAFATFLIQLRFGLIPRDLTPNSLASVSLPYIGLMFFFLAWSTIRTPVALQKAGPYIRQQAHQSAEILKRLANFCEREKEVLKFILDNGSVEFGSLSAAGFDSKISSEAIRKGKLYVLVVEERTPPLGHLEEIVASRGVSRFQINPELKPLLLRIFHTAATQKGKQ